MPLDQSFSHAVSEDDRRDELCQQLAENLHDLGASEFSRELIAGGSKFLVRVVREERRSKKREYPSAWPR